MKLRKAEISDLPRLAGCAEAFYSASQFLKRFDIQKFTDLWTALINNGTGVIFLLEHEGEITGTIGGMIYPEPYSGELVASEFFWFVHEANRGGGIRLYKAFEQWARDNDCSQIMMVHLCDSMPDKLERVYKHFGYQAAEVRYVKELTK